MSKCRNCLREKNTEGPCPYCGYDDAAFSGIAPDRAALYRLGEEKNVGITVMKGFFGGRLFDKAQSPFGVAFTPTQLIHYALTRPGVASILCGFDTGLPV